VQHAQRLLHVLFLVLQSVTACLAAGWLAATVPFATAQDPLQQARAEFDRQHYDRALALAEPLLRAPDSKPDAWRLTIRSLNKLGRPAEALPHYDRLQSRLGREDDAILGDIALQFIIAVLKDMREQMRGAGYTALKELDSDVTVPYFQDGLSDASAFVRTLAVEGLGRLKSPSRFTLLKAALKDPAAMVRLAALKALGRSGDRSMIPLLEPALTDEQTSVRIAAAGALVMLGKADAWNRIVEAAKVPNPEERGAALRMLGELKDLRALAILRPSLQDPQPSVRGAAAMALGDLGHPESLPALLGMLTDNFPPVRSFAALGLGELFAEESVPGLTHTLTDGTPGVRAAAASALLRMGHTEPIIFRTIRDLARDADPGIRASAARVLSPGEKRKPSLRGATQEASDILQSLLDDPVPRPRIAAARAFGHVGTRQHLPILKQALHDQDEAVRATAGGAIGRILGAHSVR
jgi:HEAT repeat protein